MTVRRVFVFWKHPIFHESVCLLLRHPEVEMIGATSNYKAVPIELSNLRPDTILVEEAEDMGLAEMSQILQAITWGGRVLTFNLVDNKLSIFHRQQKIVGRYDDLLHLVLDELP
jgi:DNA-binding NarL/FixJ family response regulator